jgi:transmembrane sensor
MEENYFLAKWLNNELTEKELADFKTTADFEKYEKIKKHSSHLEVDDFNESNMLQEIISHKKANQQTIPLYKKWFVQIAAILVIALGISFVLQQSATETEFALNGKKTSFSLPDNSKVTLNSGSEINYKKRDWSNHRNLELSGEAYFKVAKGKTFEVSTALGKITVLGTQFNVKSRKNRLDVSCYEGRVKVNYNNQEVVLTKGKSIAFADGSPIEIPESDVIEPEWLNKELVFKKEKIDNVLSELNRQFDVEITVNSKPLNQLFTGTIPVNNLDQSLQILTSVYHLKSRKVNRNKIILETVDTQK